MEQLEAATAPAGITAPAPGPGGAVATRPGDAAARPAAAPRGRIGRSRAWAGLAERLAAWAPFAGLVALPTLLAGLYFGAVAADRYVAEAQFVVRSAERGPATGLGAILQSTGLGAAEGDAFLVEAFLTSRDALGEIDAALGYGRIMGPDSADFLTAWPNLIDDASFEGMYDHYRRRVMVARDLATGISTLRVEAFSAQDALALADGLLDAGEAFVNRINLRALSDSLALARNEVALAEARVADVQAAFSAFRREAGLVSPVEGTEMQMRLVAELSSDLAALEAEISRIESSVRSSPQLPALRARLAALSRQVEAEKSKLVGTEGALAERYGAFESLLLEQEFAQEALMIARSGYEQARLDAQRKQRYLERVVNPRAPDDAREPRRLRMILSVAAGAALLYAIVWLLWVNAREHRG